MNKLAWGLLMITLASCTDRNPNAVHSRSRGDVSNFKADTSAFSFTLETERGGRHIETVRNGRNIASRIATPEGRRLFELSVEFGRHGVVVTEATDTDRLTVRQSIVANEIRESYDLNGRRLDVSYPRLDIVTMRKSMTSFERGDYTRIDPLLLQAFLKFEAFYDADTSLHSNRDGEDLVRALLSPEIAREIRTRAASQVVGSTAPLATPGEISLYCAVIGVGTGLKCFFGGGANPVCLAGAYHSLACGLIEIVCGLWWSC